MLFNSYVFLLMFLPITLIGYFLLARRGAAWGAGWLAVASIFFYGWWDYHYVPLLLLSVGFNYLIAIRIRGSEGALRKGWLVLALSGDLALLAYFKYANFFMSAVSDLTGQGFAPLNIILPAGISFFTFTQIAFLVDTYRGKVREARLIHYVLFVTYFPHLIAGPVLHHKEMMPQFADAKNYRPQAINFAVGLSLFSIGLAKKVLIADNLAPFANQLFGASGNPYFLAAWAGVLAYAFQLYFDFSGYSDMALGLSRMFGVRLPLNFNSPYKSGNIIEFWRRWHMTLSRFLRDYLYIALGGNRGGPSRRYVNLMLTMVLGGLWHGAGWNFLIWGGLHGAFLMVNHGWRALWRRSAPAVAAGRPAFASIALTFVVVCFAWVFFRAATLESAWLIVRGMLGGFGFSLPEAIGSRLGGLGVLLSNWGVVFSIGGASNFVESWGWITLAALLVFACPNSQQILARFDPALEPVEPAARTLALHWTPRPLAAASVAILFVACLLALNRPSEFLYFQF